MKLSEALEHCINTGLYDRTSRYTENQYMCHALKAAGYPNHAESCRNKVVSLGTGWTALASALSALGVFSGEGEEYDINANQACLDFFHKWIEELKEQGL